MTKDSVDDIQAETQARRLLTAAYDSVPGGRADGELLGAVRRHVRRTARARAGVVAGATGLVAAGAAVAFAVTSIPGASPAMAAVTSAVTKTSATSFGVSLTVIDGDSPGGLASPSSPFRMTGTFNPGQGTGQETTSNGYQTRFTGGHVYARWPQKPHGAKPWNEQPPGARPLTPLSDGPGAKLAWDYNSATPVDPAELLSLLKAAGDIRDEGPVSGAGWSGTKYGFTVGNPVPIVRSDTGTLAVDRDGHLRQLDQTITFTPAAGQPVTKADVLTLDFTFSEFGTPVHVTAPPASETGHSSELVGVQF